MVNLVKQRKKWIIAWGIFWGAFGLGVAICIYAGPHSGELPPEELTDWLLLPVIIVFASVIIGGIFGFELHDWRETRRKRKQELNQPANTHPKP
jgi:hypothetical protein